MKKLNLLLLFIFIGLGAIAQVGTPSYFNAVPTTSTNAFPWNSTTSNKVQWIYAPGAFTTAGGGAGAAAPSGMAISKIYIRIQTANATNIYTPDFAISLTQSGTSSTFANGTYLTGLTNVFQSSSFQFTGIVTGSWYGFTCSTPFPYDPSLSLIVECKSNLSIAGGNSVNSITGVGNQRIYGAYANAAGTAGTGLTPCGFDLISTSPCVAPPTAGASTATPSTLCTGQNISLNLAGNSIGSGQTYQWESSSSIGGPYSPVGVSGNSPALSTPATATLYYQCAVTCSGNTQYSTPVLVTVPSLFPAGNYTINSALPTAGSNYQTFAAAVSAIACGIAGPIVFDVAPGSGPYNEQISIPQIFGASATNTITFNGNGTTLTSALGPSTLELNGADFIKINGLTINNTNASTAFACHLWNGADNNKFDNCTFTVPITNTATTSVPFSVSGAQAAATTSGVSGSNDTLMNSIVSGGYYNTCFVGNSAAVNIGNYVFNNTLTEFYLYGSYNLYQNGLVIKRNIIERPTRSTISSTYGIYLTTGCVGTLVEANDIRNLFTALPTSASLCYPIYVIVDGTLGNENKIINNLIHDIVHAGVLYPIFASGADYIKIYHNTIDIQHPTSTTASATYGIYSTGTVGGIDIKNNIVTLNRGGTGARYCLYYTFAGTLSNNNVLYNSSPVSATSGIGFYLAAQITMANWQAANAAAWDQQGVSVDPLYAAPSSPSYDFTPTASAVNNAGTPVGVTTDYFNNPRSVTTPDPGIIEFALSALDIAIVNLVGPTTAGCYSTTEPIVVTIQNAGSAPLNLATNPVTFTGTVAGAATVTLSGNMNTGTIPVAGTTTFTLTPTVDMTAIGSYTINVTASLVGDGNPANDALIPAAVRTVGNTGGTITTPVNTYCVTGTPNLTLTGASGGTRQWQSSTISASGPWTNVGAGGNTFTPSPALTQTTYFQVTTTCNLNTFTSNVLTVTVNNPIITSTTPDTICGNNVASLEATTPPGNTIKWFAGASGGSSLFTGSPFTTPILNTTTTYYAEASAGGGGADSVAIPLASGTTTGVYHHMFRMNTVNAMNLTAIGIKCNMAVSTPTSWDIYYRPDNYQAVAGANTSAAGWILLSSVTNVPSAGAADYTIISLGVNLAIPANAQYSFYVAPVGAATHQYATSALGTTVASNIDASIIAGNRGSSLFNCNTSGGMACVKMIYSIGCAGTRVPVIANVNPAPIVTATPTTSTVCAGANVTLTGGGTIGVGYAWSGGISDATPFPATTSTIYTVTGTDANLCTATATSSITVNPVLSGVVSATPSTFCLGASSILNSTVTPLCLGNVNDFAGIYAPATWTPSLDNSSGNVNTAGAPANIVISTGSNLTGTPGYTKYSHPITCAGNVTFNWSTSSSPNNLGILVAPQYRINGGAWTNLPGWIGTTVSQASTPANIAVPANSTFELATYTLTNDVFDAYSLTISNFSAPAAQINGTVTIWDAPTGGNNLGAPAVTVTPAISGTVNYYAEYTTNGTGCVNVVRTPIPLTVNALPTVTATATPAAICVGGSSILSGGGASTYTWNPGAMANPATVSPTTTSTYTITGTDGNGCSNTASTSVTVNPLPVLTSMTASPAAVCFNGTSTLTVAPGITSPGTYCSSNFTNVTYEFLTNVTFAGINNTSTGNTGGPVNYTGQTASLVAGVPSTLSVTMDPDANDYIYAWIDWNKNGVLNDAGEQYIVVTNSSLAGPHTINITPPLTAINGPTRMRVMVDYLNAIPNPCRNATYGEAEDYTVNVTGGVTPAPGFATIGWSPATYLNVTNTASVTASLVASTTIYTVTGTDANGCSTSSSVTLTMNPLPVITANPSTLDTCIGSSITLAGGGAGVGGSYVWNGGISDNTPFTINANTSYTVTGTDANGCSNTATSTVTVTALPIVFAIAGGATTICEGATTSLVGFSPTPAVTFGWSPATTPATGSPVNASPLATTAYTVAATDANGCVGTSSLSITVNPLPTVTATPSTQDVCQNGSATLTGGGANTYTWTGGITNATAFTVTSSNTYTVTGTDGNNCSNTATAVVNMNTLPVVTASPSTQAVCENASATVTGGGASSYVWTGGISDATPFTVTSGPTTYTVTGTDGNGCSNTATAVVNMNAAPLVTASATPSTTCNNTSITATGGGASTYVWSGGLTDNTPFIGTTGITTYTVTGTDGIGCSATSSVTVTVTASSGTLAPATSNQSQNQADDFNLNYTDPSCNLIASVDDGAGGNILGITIATVNVDANAGVYNGQPFVRRWYQITPANNVGVSAMVTLYIEQADFTNYNSVVTAPYLPMPTSGNNADPNIPNIRITKNADAGLGNSPLVITPTTINWNGTYWELTFPVTGFSQFRVHSVNPGNAALPATITNFSGRKLNNSDMLEWTTASEQNNAYFNLQHGTDGVNFTTIAKVNSQAANGNSSSILNYNFENTKPQLGHNYYRLQQVDIDNHSTMNAKVVDIIWGTNGSTVSIYPNPTQDVLNIDLYTSKVQNTTVKVLDMSGRIVKQVQARSEAGMNKLSLSLGDIASGVYTVQVFENDQLTHVSKVKKND